MLAALAEAIAEGERRYGVTLRLIPDIVRNVGVEPADRTLDWALAGRRRGVVAALGLSGSERLYPNEPFREHFAAARARGAPPGGPRRRARGAGVDPLGARRSAAPSGSATACGRWRTRRWSTSCASGQIPLEVCPTSNLCLGVAPDLASHPFDRLYRAGLALSVSSDDPAFFNTNLTLEYLRLHQTFGYSPAEMAGLSLAALRQAFLRRAPTARPWRRASASSSTPSGQELFGAPVEPPVS